MECMYYSGIALQRTRLTTYSFTGLGLTDTTNGQIERTIVITYVFAVPLVVRCNATLLYMYCSILCTALH